MYDMLKAIFGAIVVGDFLLAIGIFALWKLSGRIVPPPSPETAEDETGGEGTSC